MSYSIYLLRWHNKQYYSRLDAHFNESKTLLLCNSYFTNNILNMVPSNRIGENWNRLKHRAIEQLMNEYVNIYYIFHNTKITWKLYLNIWYNSCLRVGTSLTQTPSKRIIFLVHSYPHGGASSTNRISSLQTNNYVTRA